MGSRIELAAGLSVTGVRAGLGRITAYPSGRLGVAKERWLLLRAEEARGPAISRVPEAVPGATDISPVLTAEVSFVGEEGIGGV